MGVHKEEKIRGARKVERKRAKLIMEEEKNMLKKLGTEVSGGMDTSLGSYSKTKDRKKANPRMGGNQTAGSEPKGKRKETGASAATNGSSVGEGGAVSKKSSKRKRKD